MINTISIESEYKKEIWKWELKLNKKMILNGWVRCEWTNESLSPELNSCLLSSFFFLLSSFYFLLSTFYFLLSSFFFLLSHSFFFLLSILLSVQFCLHLVLVIHLSSLLSPSSLPLYISHSPKSGLPLLCLILVSLATLSTGPVLPLFPQLQSSATWCFAMERQAQGCLSLKKWRKSQLKSGFR